MCRHARRDPGARAGLGAAAGRHTAQIRRLLGRASRRIRSIGCATSATRGSRSRTRSLPGRVFARRRSGRRGSLVGIVAVALAVAVIARRMVMRPQAAADSWPARRPVQFAIVAPPGHLDITRSPSRVAGTDDPIAIYREPRRDSDLLARNWTSPSGRVSSHGRRFRPVLFAGRPMGRIFCRSEDQEGASHGRRRCRDRGLRRTGRDRMCPPAGTSETRSSSRPMCRRVSGASPSNGGTPSVVTRRRNANRFTFGHSSCPAARPSCSARSTIGPIRRRTLQRLDGGERKALVRGPDALRTEWAPRLRSRRFADGRAV